MALQRCIYSATQQFLSKRIVQNTQTYCLLRHRYSSDGPRRYTDRHEWVVVENNVGTVGISKYAQEALGDVVFAQLPDVGAEFKTGDECGALESVKAASEVYCPVSGTVTEKNTAVESKPALINTSCYDQGWLFKLKITNQDELKDLMNEEQYEKFLKTDADSH